ncbi:MAG: phosphoribosylanthranilate isomerase [Thermoanaerobaculia bacterium]|nr:phosphoribosylanthranilate isomerase [Thermoanaerobaculia bacterium]
MRPPARRPWVKICGVTREADAERAVELGADFLGLNFWPGSPRRVGPERAARIARVVAGRAALVGIFVNATAEEIDRARAAAPLALVQLHGDEPPEEVARHGSLALPALRLTAGAPAPDLSLYPHAWGFLVESRRPGEYGGTGAAWEYARIAGLSDGRPVLVAGGIRPETAAAALEASGAHGVDVCSGVESAPGIKDPARMAALFAALGRARPGDPEATRSQSE